MTFLRWIFAFTTSWACCAACTPVAGSRIFARDLATADARFAALPSTLAVGFTPTPGAKRVFAAAELARIAKANGLELSGVGLSGVVADVCFELAMHRADGIEVLAALRRSAPQGAHVSIVELPQFDIPAGQMEFPLGELEPAASGTSGSSAVRLWRGYVKYAETRRAPFWARVTVEIPHVPQVVAKGDSIRVEVRSGLAHLHFDAVVEMPAPEGGTVELRNPFNGKTLKARLESKSLAVVDADAVRGGNR